MRINIQVSHYCTGTDHKVLGKLFSLNTQLYSILTISGYFWMAICRYCTHTLFDCLDLPFNFWNMDMFIFVSSSDMGF